MRVGKLKGKEKKGAEDYIKGERKKKRAGGQEERGRKEAQGN